MKITPQHFDHFRSLVAPFDTPERRAEAIENGYTDKRYRWSLTYIVHSTDPQSATRFICDVLYVYLNDTHIDTALRALVPPLGNTKEAA